MASLGRDGGGTATGGSLKPATHVIRPLFFRKACRTQVQNCVHGASYALRVPGVQHAQDRLAADHDHLVLGRDSASRPDQALAVLSSHVASVGAPEPEPCASRAGIGTAPRCSAGSSGASSGAGPWPAWARRLQRPGILPDLPVGALANPADTAFIGWRHRDPALEDGARPGQPLRLRADLVRDEAVQREATDVDLLVAAGAIESFMRKGYFCRGANSTSPGSTSRTSTPMAAQASTTATSSSSGMSRSSSSGFQLRPLSSA